MVKVTRKCVIGCHSYKNIVVLFSGKKLAVTVSAYLMISHKGAGPYIWIFKIFGFVSFKNRTALSRPAPIFFSQKYSMISYIEHIFLKKYSLIKNYDYNDKFLHSNTLFMRAIDNYFRKRVLLFCYVAALWTCV